MKRDRDTAIWKDPFYRGLPPLYKCLWDFINDDCDNCGVWTADFKVASLVIGRRVKPEIAQQLFGSKVQLLDDGRKWWIKGFIFETLGFTGLSPSHKFQKSILDLLNKHNLKFSRESTDTLQSVIDIDMGKGNEKDMEREGVQGENQLEEPLMTPMPQPPEVKRTFDFQGKFLSAFDERTMERYGMSFKGIDLLEELQQFRLKCDNDPMSYHHRDAGGLRNAFQHQLKTAKPKNGNITSKKQHPAQSLAQDHANKYGGTSA